MDDTWVRWMVAIAIGLVAYIAAELRQIRKMLAWRNEKLADQLYPDD